MLGNLTAGERTPYLRQVRPDLFGVSQTPGEILDIGRPVGEVINGLAHSWLLDDLIDAGECVSVIGDDWFPVSEHLALECLDPFDVRNFVHLGSPPESVEGGESLDSLLDMGSAPLPVGAVVDARGKVHRKGGVEARVIEMLKEGCTPADVSKAVNWQHHTFRGFVSEGIRVRYGLVVLREKIGKGKGSVTRYRLAD
jgi:hypothetical protein